MREQDFPFKPSLLSPHIPRPVCAYRFARPLCNSVSIRQTPDLPNLELSGTSGLCRPALSLHRGGPRPRKGHCLAYSHGAETTYGRRAQATRSRVLSPTLGRLHSPASPSMPTCWRRWAGNERAVPVSWLPRVSVLYEVQSIIQNPFWGRLAP